MTPTKMPRARVSRVLAIFGLFGLAACSSVVEGTTQSVLVKTDPPGANCELTREGTAIAVVNPTPGSVTVEKSKRDIAVNCLKEQHETGAAVLSSKFESMTLGNILIGGIVGLAIDASSGAINKYPESILVVMPPTSFPTVPARDRYYDALIARINTSADETIEKILAKCGSPESEECKQDIEVVEKHRDEQITEFEAKRARARIETG